MTEQGEEKHTQQQMASRKHGMYAFERRGPDALEQEQQTYLMELRQLFKTQPGRLEYREQLAASLAMMCELGFQSIRKQAERGGDLWKANVTGRLGTYVNTLVRMLDSWPEDDQDRPKNVIDLLQGTEGRGEAEQGEQA